MATLTWVQWSPSSSFGGLDPMYASVIVQGVPETKWFSSFDDPNYLRPRWDPRFRLENIQQSWLRRAGPERASQQLLDLFLSSLQGEGFQHSEFVEHFWGSPLDEITIQTIERFVNQQGSPVRHELANRVMLLRATGFRTIREWHTHRLLVRRERMTPVDQAKRLGLRIVFPDNLIDDGGIIQIEVD